MKRTHEKSPQLVTSPKPTTLNLQTRAFAPIQSDSSQVNQQSENSLEQSHNSSSDSLLEKLISNSSVSSDRPIQRKSLHRFPIQAKLNIGEPNDKYEKEADATASKVVQQINSPNQNSSIQRLKISDRNNLQAKSFSQKREKTNGGEATEDLESSIQSARGRGQALDTHLQAKMGQAMGADFSGVKVHTDSQADQLNESIQAKAFTTGHDVFFRQGAYDPSSHSGQELIAHELAHVVQQNGNNIQRKSQVPDIQRGFVKDKIKFFESLSSQNEEEEEKVNSYSYNSDSSVDNEYITSEQEDNSYGNYEAVDNEAQNKYNITSEEEKEGYKNREYSGSQEYSGSGVSDSTYVPSPELSPNEEEEYDDNYEAPKKFKKINPRLSKYQGENQNSRYITHVQDIFNSLRSRKDLKTQYGWSEEDIVKYYDNKEKTRVKYLNKESRKDYELTGSGTLMQGEPPTPFDTSKMFSKHSGQGFGIYVMSPNGELYSHAHKVGLFHHSSFLAGLPTAGAGEIKVAGGVVQHITNKSGHYTPDEENMVQTLEEFQSRGINLSGVKLSLVDGSEYDSAQQFLDSKKNSNNNIKVIY